ncbi:unnamed protein product [Cyprideis torosa]|uniref:Uncharacterized protein n=1 Tax=Cyprideis torosa TaxID=163714 RepID=A0A7R8ZV17_9CRUS|nr:unnamed protein product [Cyprideis torosa]CAG0902034.1 unnamed protein product [Cyprideis torosa]
MKYSHHTMSVTFLRGSVPVYWSQPGLKYRPAPRLNRSYWESHEAFVKHFEMELESFHRLCIVNLVERRGPEDILGREYLRHVLDMDSPKLDYVAFDFHEYCRGLRFGNVSFLVAAVLELMKYLSFCWVDSQGFICQQRGAFRVSCMDCLDRTNVVQGDYTRTGERRLAGLMRDGVNSASRYYLSQFRDAYRQAAFDLLQGRPLDPSLLGLEEDEDPTCQMEVAPQPSATMDRVREVMDNVRRQLLEDEEPPMGTWGLRDGEGVYDSASTEEEDVDVILILTRNAYVVAWLDDTLSSFSECEWVPLRSLQSIDLSLTELRLTFRACPDSSTPASDGAPPFTLGRFQCPAPDLPTTDIPLRSHLFRSSRFRFFNNAPLLINSDEEKAESLRTIAETFCAVHPSLCDDDFQYAFHHPSLPALPSTPLRLPSPTPCRKHLRSTSPKISPPSLAATDTPPPRHPQPPSTISITSIKQFGGRVCSRALGNVTSGLSRLHPRSLQGRGRREGAEEQKVRPEQLPSFVLTPENEQQLQDQASLDFSPLTSSHSMPLLPSSGPSLAPPAAPVPASSPLSLSSSRSSGDLSLEVPPPNGSSRGPTQAPPSTPDPRSPFRLLARGVQSLVGGGATRCKIPADDEETRALEERKMRCKSRIMEL